MAINSNAIKEKRVPKKPPIKVIEDIENDYVNKFEWHLVQAVKEITKYLVK